MVELCRGMVAAGTMVASEREIAALARNVLLVATYWQSFDRIGRPCGCRRRGPRPRSVAGACADRVRSSPAKPRAGRPAGPRLPLKERLPWRRNGSSFRTPRRRYAYDAAGLKKHWSRLHQAATASRSRRTPPCAGAWRHYHAGEFAQAVDAGNAAGGAGRERRDQGAGRLRDLPREERQGEARAARGGDGLGRGAPREGAEGSRTRTTSSRSPRAATARASRSRRRSRRAWAARSATRSRRRSSSSRSTPTRTSRTAATRRR